MPGSPIASGLMALGMGIGALKMLGETLEGLDRALNGPEEPSKRVGACGMGSDPKCQVFNVSGIKDRVAHIRKLILKYSEDPQFIIKARQIVSQKCGDSWCIQERDYWGEVKALWSYVKDNLRYVRDHLTKDTYYNPNANLKSGGADCDDFVITLNALARAIGYETAMVVIRTKGARDFNHIYSMVNVNPKGAAKWVPIDASVSWINLNGQRAPAYPGWEAPASMVAEKRIFRV